MRHDPRSQPTPAPSIELCQVPPPQLMYPEVLRYGGAIGETEEHNKWFKQLPVGPEGCLPFVFLLDVHIVVTPPDVQFCEVLHTPEVVDEFGDEGERVAILHHHSIEYLVVLYQLEGAILHLDEEDWRSHWGFGQLDMTRVQVLLEEGIELILLSGHEGVDLTAGGCRVMQQFNGVVPPLALQKQVKGGLGEYILKCMQVGEYHLPELFRHGVSSKGLGQPLGHSLASPDLCNRGWLVDSRHVNLISHLYCFVWELWLVYAAKLPSMLLLQGSTIAPIVLVEGLPMRECQRQGDLGPMLCSVLCGAGRALPWASAHGHLSSGPVNLGVMLSEPCKPKDYVLPPQADNGKYGVLHMVLILENQIHHGANGTGFIEHFINVVDQNGLKEELCSEAVVFDKLCI
ncbi:hypothetical protein E4T56_gene586 [Termitomyces sp. T112]|nr:hypothetical protein E4T56_gene586 [Termitomyces sp. T112]